MGAKTTPGINVRHGKACAARAGRPCDCKPTFQAQVYDAATDRRIRKTFASIGQARTWRQDAVVALRSGKLDEAKPRTTVEEVCDAWLEDARRGIVRTRGGDELKAGTLRSYDQALRLRVFPAIGHRPFYRVRRAELQDIVDRLVADGSAPATIGVMVGALGAIYGRAVQRDELEVNPTAGVRVPTARNGRERFATPVEAAALLAAVPERDRPIWAMAMYAGLRRGELLALRWENVDLKAGTIDVVQSWDLCVGPQPTKNRGRRRVPIAAALRETLAGARLRQTPGVELCFGLGPHRPFAVDKLQQRADKAWEAAKLERLTLHDCRHSFASLMIAANVNAKALSTFMGHHSVTLTLDRYGHLMPGSESEAAGLLDAYLEAAAAV